MNKQIGWGTFTAIVLTIVGMLFFIFMVFGLLGESRNESAGMRYCDKCKDKTPDKKNGRCNVCNSIKPEYIYENWNMAGYMPNGKYTNEDFIKKVINA